MNIVIGMCGGIACYKICSLIRELKKLNFEVDVIMTKNATNFITPLTIKSLSNNPVVVDMFHETDNFDIEHISLAQKADIILIAPATANMIGKIANGIADDMLSTVVMATKAKVIIAPAMNNNMYTNPIVEQNIKKLKEFGYLFIDPQVGELACGTTAIGKLADTKTIVDYVMEIANEYNNN